MIHCMYLQDREEKSLPRWKHQRLFAHLCIPRSCAPRCSGVKRRMTSEANKMMMYVKEEVSRSILSRIRVVGWAVCQTKTIDSRQIYHNMHPS